MYISNIHISDFRTFAEASVDFVHRGLDFKQLGLPRPKFPNVNLLLGNNGSGKTTMLKAVSIAALGPAVDFAALPVYRLIRREPKSVDVSEERYATITAAFKVHPQDDASIYVRREPLVSGTTFVQLGDAQIPNWMLGTSPSWSAIYSDSSNAFFFVGYGATRRVEAKETVDPGARQTSSLIRAQRVRSLFEEAYSLMPLSAWLPHLKISDPGRYAQVTILVDRLLVGTGYHLVRETVKGEYEFERRGLRVPFPALSDGYRAYLGWIGDLLYHVCQTCPSDKKLVENRGIVLVDEIDLHLHPKWQMTVLPTISRALPNIQFIVTSHSPLVVGSLEWMNIIMMSPRARQASRPVHLRQPVHGLDADQVLLTDFFGLQSTRALSKTSELKKLSLAASNGNSDAALRLIEKMSEGTETMSDPVS